MDLLEDETSASPGPGVRGERAHRWGHRPGERNPNPDGPFGKLGDGGNLPDPDGLFPPPSSPLPMWKRGFTTTASGFAMSKRSRWSLWMTRWLPPWRFSRRSQSTNWWPSWGDRDLFGKGVPVHFFGQRVFFPIAPPFWAISPRPPSFPRLCLMDRRRETNIGALPSLPSFSREKREPGP